MEKFGSGFREHYFQSGAFIGRVDLVDCVVNHDSVWAAHDEDFLNEVAPSTRAGKRTVYNWVLANPVQFENDTMFRQVIIVGFSNREI